MHLSTCVSANTKSVVRKLFLTEEPSVGFAYSAPFPVWLLLSFGNHLSPTLRWSLLAGNDPAQAHSCVGPAVAWPTRAVHVSGCGYGNGLDKQHSFGAFEAKSLLGEMQDCVANIQHSSASPANLSYMN